MMLRPEHDDPLSPEYTYDRRVQILKIISETNRATRGSMKRANRLARDLYEDMFGSEQ